MWRSAMALAVFGVSLALSAHSNACDKCAKAQDQQAIQQTFEKFAKTEIVFTATLASVQEGPTALSEPPIRSFLLEFTGAQATRGNVPAKVKGWYHVKSRNPPIFKEGQGCT